MDYTVTIYSNRLYELDSVLEKDINTTIYEFSKAMYSSYNRHFLKEFNETEFVNKYGTESLHMLTKKSSGFDTYYTNGVERRAKGFVDSSKELTNQYKKDKKEQLKAIDKKIQTELDKLAQYENLLNNYNDYRLNKTKKLKVGKLKHIKSCGNMITVRDLNTFENTAYKLYQFEYEYLRPKIKSIKNKISKLKYRRNNINTKLKNLDSPKKIVFGGKKKIKELTPMELFDKKYKEFTIPGRADAKFGNWVFKTTPLNNQTFNVEFKLIDGKQYTLNVQFPYRGDELKEVLNNNMNKSVNTPIEYGIVKKKDALNRYYYQIKVTFNIGSTKKYINPSMDTGCVGCDFNAGHIDWSDIDRHGNLIDYGVIKYQLDRSSKENELSLRKALDQLGEIVSHKKKILVVEDIDLHSARKKSTYRNKKLNKIIHLIPYAKYLEFIDYLSYKYEFLVIKVHPADTSKIGKIKYQDIMKLPSHIAASFVIARRGMHFQRNEKVPKQYKDMIKDIKTKHYWSKFNKIEKELKKQKEFKNKKKMK